MVAGTDVEVQGLATPPSHLTRLGARLAQCFELQNRGPRLLPMEGLRGFSAFLVFFVHFNERFGAFAADAGLREALALAGTFGHCGVDVFFALSGFIMYGMLLRKNEVGYFDFIRRRIVRLYPAFIAVFAVYVALNSVFHVKPWPGSLAGKLGYLLVNFLMLPGILPIEPLIVVAWSLSYELCFYLVLPLVIRCTRMAAWRVGARIAFLLALCAVHLLLVGLGLAGHPRMVMFAGGMLLWETVSFRKIWERPIWSWTGNCAATALFAAALGVYGAARPSVWSRYCNTAGPGCPSHVFLLLAATYVLCYFAMGGGGMLASFFRWAPLRWSGNMSYSYYLIHGLVLQAIRKAMDFSGAPQSLSLGPFLALLILAFAATVGAGAALFLAVERPFSFSSGSRRA